MTVSDAFWITLPSTIAAVGALITSIISAFQARRTNTTINTVHDTVFTQLLSAEKQIAEHNGLEKGKKVSNAEGLTTKIPEGT